MIVLEFATAKKVPNNAFTAETDFIVERKAGTAAFILNLSN